MIAFRPSTIDIEDRNTSVSGSDEISEIRIVTRDNKRVSRITHRKSRDDFP